MLAALIRRFVLSLALVFCLANAAAADDAVDLELVLLADASGSIDNAEILFQRQGYATAITHPDVLNAIAGGYLRRIAITYVFLRRNLRSFSGAADTVERTRFGKGIGTGTGSGN